MSNNILSRRTVVMMVFVFLFASIGASAADAKPPKMRGSVISIDESAKTLTIDHKKKGETALKWTAETKFKKCSPSDIKPGDHVVTWLESEGSDTFISLRHTPAGAEE